MRQYLVLVDDEVIDENTISLDDVFQLSDTVQTGQAANDVSDNDDDDDGDDDADDSKKVAKAIGSIHVLDSTPLIRNTYFLPCL